MTRPIRTCWRRAGPPAVARDAARIDRALSFRSAGRPQTVRAFRDSLDWGEEAAPTELTRLPADRRICWRGPPLEAIGVRLQSPACLPLWASPAFWLSFFAPRTISCGVEGLEQATLGGEAELAAFLKTCASAPLAGKAEGLLNARIDEREGKQARDAGFDIGKLETYGKNCTRCRDRADVEGRIALIRDEEAAYRAAKGSVERLEAYVRQCKACLHRDEAQREIKSLQQGQAEAKAKAEAMAKADDDAFNAAKGSIDRLENYLKTCKLCRHRADAERELENLRKQQADREKADREKVALPNLRKVCSDQSAVARFEACTAIIE